MSRVNINLTKADLINIIFSLDRAISSLQNSCKEKELDDNVEKVIKDMRERKIQEITLLHHRLEPYLWSP